MIVIGCDEALKGDSFGGIVCAGFFCSKELEKEFSGILESKRMVDNKIILTAERLIEQYPDNFYVVNIDPVKYNELIKTQTMTEILNASYIEIMTQLMPKAKNNDLKIVVDEYPGAKVLEEYANNIVVMPKAESYYIQVAIASVLARYFGLKQIEELSKKANIRIPLGSTHVSDALQYMKDNNFNFKEYAKMNFKNVRLFL